MIDPSELESWLEVGVFIVTAVWAVSKIKSTTEVLSTSMDHLSNTMKSLDNRVETVRRDLGGISSRLTRLETIIETADRSVSIVNERGN